MYTLHNFVTDLPMKSLKILTKPFDFTNVSVKSISVQELPLDTFVREGEIILSTLIGCLDNDDVFKQFIRDIKISRAAALVVAFKDPDYQLSDDIVSFAIDVGLPILSLPWEIRFADVISATTQQIHDKNIENYKHTRDRLFTSYFSSQPLDEAAHILSKFFDAPVAIVGKNLKIKGKSGEDISAENCAVVDISIHQVVWGHLYICNPEKNQHLLKNAQLLEQHIFLPLSMWFNKENIEKRIVLKIKNDFVWDLASKNYTSFKEMVHQGAKLGFNLSASYVCIAFCVKQKDSTQLLDEYSTQSAQLCTFIEDLIVKERKRQRVKVMYADRGLEFIVYMDVSQVGNEVINEFVENIAKAFVSKHPELQLYCGISNISPENSELFHQLCQNAQLALQYCINSKSSECIFTYKDTKFHRIISELSGNKNIKKLASETLDTLLEHDKTSSMDLMNTLVEFIKNDGNTSQTARSLHLNRQSLLYRLKKIETLTGLSLSQHQDLFLLELFTRIHSYY